jgi:cytochrome c oxidase assembly factor CtaG
MLNAIQAALVLLGLLGLLMRVRNLRRAGRPVSGLGLACVVLGAAAILAAIYALREPGSRLLYWHTAERLLIGDVASLLIAFGLTSMSAPSASGARRRVALLMQPRIALPLWTAFYLAWMLPGPYDAAMRHQLLRLIDNVLLVGLSLNMWLALLRTARSQRPPSPIWPLSYVLIGRIVGAAVACVAIWSPDVYYPYFLRGESISFTSPLADQGIAGAIVLAEMALTAIVLLLWLRTQVAATSELDRSSEVAATAEPAPAQPAAASALAAADAQA